MKKLVCVIIICACLALVGCAEREITVPKVVDDTTSTVSDDTISETTETEPTEAETAPIMSEEPEPDTEPAIETEPEVDTDIPEDDGGVQSELVREVMYGETADLSFVDITELGEIKWAEIQMFEWHETGDPLGIAEVRSAEDIALLNEMFGSLSLEKMEYMEPSPEVFRMYLYAKDGAAARISVTPEPYPNINDYRIVGGELDMEALTKMFERNK